MARKLNLEFGSSGAKELSNQLRGLTAQINTFGSTVKKGFALFLGHEITKSVLDFQKTLFDLSRTSKLVGQNFGSLEKAIEDINKTTALSRDQSAQWLSQMQKNQKGLRLTAQESTKLAQVLSNEFGPALEDVAGATEKLLAIQNKQVHLLKNLKSNMSPEDVRAYAASLVMTGKATEEQAQAMIRASDAFSKKGGPSDQEKAMLRYRNAVTAVEKVWKDFRLIVGVPVTNTLSKMLEVFAKFGNKINDVIKNSKELNKVLAAIPVAAAGFAGLGLAGKGASLMNLGGGAGGMLGGIAKKAGPLSKGLAGGAAFMGGQVLGDAVGGRAGAGIQAAGNVAGGAMTGAALGSMVAPGIGTAIGGIIGGLGGLLGSLDQLKAAIPGLSPFIEELSTHFGPAKDAFAEVIAAAKSLGETAFVQLRDIMTTVWDSVKSIMPTLIEFGNALAVRLAKSITAAINIMEPLIELMSIGLQEVIKALTPAIEIMVSWMTKMQEALTTVTEALGDFVSDALKAAIEFSKGGRSGYVETEGDKKSRLIRERIAKQGNDAVAALPVGASKEDIAKARNEAYSVENIKKARAEVLKLNIAVEKTEEAVKKTNDEYDKSKDAINKAYEELIKGMSYAKQITDTTDSMVQNYMRIAEIMGSFQNDLGGSFEQFRQTNSLLDIQEQAWQEVAGLMDKIKGSRGSTKDIEAQIGDIIRGAMGDTKETAAVIEKLLGTEEGRLEANRQMSEIEAKRWQAYSQQGDLLAERTQLESQQVDLMQAQMDLTKSMYLGLGPTLDMQMEMVDAIERQIEATEREISLVREYEKEYGSNARSQAKLNQLQLNKVNLVKKELDITKNLREGYLDAMQAFTNVEGFFSKIILKRDMGMGMLQRDMQAAKGLKVGAIGGGGDEPIARYRAGGRLEFSGTDDWNRRMKTYGEQDLPVRGRINTAATGAQYEPYFRGQDLQRQTGLPAQGQRATGPTGLETVRDAMGGAGTRDLVVTKLEEIKGVLLGQTETAKDLHNQGKRDAKDEAQRQNVQENERNRKRLEDNAKPDDSLKKYYKGLEDSLLKEQEEWAKYYETNSTDRIMGNTNTSGVSIGNRRGGAARFAAGGWVGGAAGYDAVPAMLTAGEFVVNAKSARNHAGILSQINGYANGGPVKPPLFMTGGGGFSPKFNINVRGDSAHAIMGSVNSQLGSILSSMMANTGGSGRFQDLPQSG